jgi:hypothetical protein
LSAFINGWNSLGKHRIMIFPGSNLAPFENEGWIKERSEIFSRMGVVWMI